MRKHPEIKMVSRDRGGEYASAASAGAPQAIQCADRFHILKNLGEALEGLLARHLVTRRKEKVQEILDEHTPAWQPTRSAKRSPTLERLQQARREGRLALSDQVVALRKQGLSQQAIALRVGIGASTVGNWLAAGTFPERKPREQACRLDPYLPYVLERWQQGCHNIACLFRELVDRGYKGSYASVYDPLVRLLPQGRKYAPGANAISPAPLLSAREATFLAPRVGLKN